MPTYEYKCLNCGHTFEVFQSMSAEPVKECPKCKGPVKRLIGSGLSPIFKGSGFYQTDYKNNTGKPPATQKKENKKAETKKETKNPDAGNTKKE